MNKKRLILPVFLLLVISWAARPETHVSDTKYDWTELAESITEGKYRNYDKLHAIYRWICQNIAYDTSRTIYHSDECIENYKGVCQAYCEVFYRLAEAVGIHTEIISGDCHNNTEYYPRKYKGGGHAWIFAFTDYETGEGILIDPTWGAGSVNDGVFKRSADNDSWFNVRPEWLIFTHFPNDEKFQLLETKVTREEFNMLPVLRPSLAKFGLKGKNLLEQALNRHYLDIPYCYGHVLAEDKNIDYMIIPEQGTLNPDKTYRICIKGNISPNSCMMFGESLGNDIRSRQKSQRTIDGWTIVTFSPLQPGDLSFGIKQNPNSNRYKTYCEFKVM